MEPIERCPVVPLPSAGEGEFALPFHEAGQVQQSQHRAAKPQPQERRPSCPPRNMLKLETQIIRRGGLLLRQVQGRK